MGLVELTAAATAFQSLDSSLCSVNYTFPVEMAQLSIAPVQLATLTKQLTHIIFSQLVNASQATKTDYGCMDSFPSSTIHSLSANFFNVMLNISSIFRYCCIIRDYCISGRLRNAESVLYFTDTFTLSSLLQQDTVNSLWQLSDSLKARPVQTIETLIQR